MPEQPTATLHFTVTDDDTALAVGSGSLPVLGTPRLIAWCEAATCAVALPAADRATATSVGTRIEFDHVAASRVGAEITVTAVLAESAGRRLRYDVRASDAAGREVGRGVVHRALVDPSTFLAGLD